MVQPTKTFVEQKTGMEFVWIPAGSFLMGVDSNFEDIPYRHEQPHHKVTLSGFYMGKTPATQAQWVTVMGTNPSKNKGRDYPVTDVNYDEAKLFCHKLGCRLPTEAEWEYAARAGTLDRHIISNDESCIGGFAWYGDNSENRVHPVGQKLPNPWGLYDVLGNVCEWVDDWYDEAYYSRSPERSPTGPASGSYRIYRGGSFYNGRDVRVSNRCRSRSDDSCNDLGFRCAMSE